MTAPSTATINEVQLTDVTAKTFTLNEGSATLNNLVVATFKDPGNDPGTRKTWPTTRRRSTGATAARLVTGLVRYNREAGCSSVVRSHTYMGDTILPGKRERGRGADHGEDHARDPSPR